MPIFMNVSTKKYLKRINKLERKTHQRKRNRKYNYIIYILQDNIKIILSYILKINNLSYFTIIKKSFDNYELFYTNNNNLKLDIKITTNEYNNIKITINTNISYLYIFNFNKLKKINYYEKELKNIIITCDQETNDKHISYFKHNKKFIQIIKINNFIKNKITFNTDYNILSTNKVFIYNKYNQAIICATKFRFFLNDYIFNFYYFIYNKINIKRSSIKVCINCLLCFYQHNFISNNYKLLAII